ncbi:MAG TPA: valine--tRNA ligase [Spirochaetia bacterium]|nr:valine--tRNA ligase [Spirochaetia bacterium]
MGMENIPTTYDPAQVEEKWYRHWEEKGFFHAPVDEGKKPYCIVMPPPNVTGQLHMGHALDNAIQDTLIRWRRMQGFNTLWLPGTDHAGIATQAKVEESLAAEGLSRNVLGRDKFLERVWAWKERYGGRITAQLRRLGSSCDWQRERFTMDEGCSRAVREVFVRLFEQGLIYRDYYITNWCPHCHTTISDIEVEHEETAGHLYYLRYPAAGHPPQGGSGWIEVATTRPETILGDVAVAVHPDDERYRSMVGTTVILPLVGRELPVIADEYVDPAFGTGAVKITPAHDPNDFEVGRRHNLPQIKVMGEDAAMNSDTGPYSGLDRYECRKRIVRDLRDGGYLVRIEDITHSVGQCYRCNTVIEPALSRQWFVRMKPLAEPATLAALKGQVTFIPERFTRIYLNWMENIRDWCISRQLWWGHRIPVWYCAECGEMTAAVTQPDRCRCGSTGLEQDPDVLDTWFSSGLWPFSTLGWPCQTAELAYFYPTSVLVTGRDIIFFWVARMIFLGLAFQGEVPFPSVFIHGLVLDPLGRKMSKSLGNGVDPIDVIESHGADSLRFMLLTGNTPGNDIRFNFERLEGARNFANKLWNASRFVLMNLEGYSPGEETAPPILADRWILNSFNDTVRNVTQSLEAFELGEAVRLAYEFIRGEYCDWYIELAKPRLYGADPLDRALARRVLVQVLRGTLELLHPFMPFITEEIWQHLPGAGPTVMLAPWPACDPELSDPEARAKMDLIQEVTRVIRHLRTEVNVPPGKKVNVLIGADDYQLAVLEEGSEIIASLAQAVPAFSRGTPERPEQSVQAVAGVGVTVVLPLKGVLDVDKEKARIQQEQARLRDDMARTRGKLANEAFLAKAPPAVVEKEKGKAAEMAAKLEALTERLALLG